jgi:hypothetical protein
MKKKCVLINKNMKRKIKMKEKKIMEKPLKLQMHQYYKHGFSNGSS